MRLDSNILYEALDKLETSKSSFHSLGLQAAGCVANVDSSHNIDVLYPAKNMSKFTMRFNFYHTKGFFC